MNRCYYILAFFAVASSATVAVAQSDVDLGTVVVHESQETTSKESPSAFTTVIHPDQTSTAAQTLPQLISKESPVSIHDLGGPGQYSSISIRGSTAEQVGIYIDGMPLNTGSRGAVDLTSLPMSHIKRIEIIRGSQGTELGPDAMGGAIHLITRKDKPGREITASATGGSFWTGRGNVAYHEQRPTWTTTASFGHFQTAGDYSFQSASTSLGGTSTGSSATFTRIHNRSRIEDGFVAFEKSLTSTITLSLSQALTYTNRDIPGTEEETTQLYPTNPLEANESILHTVSKGMIRFDDIAIPTGTLELGLFHHWLRDQFHDPSPALGNPISVSTDDSTLTPYLSLSFFPTHGPIEHAITTRYDFSRIGLTGNGSHHRLRHSLILKDELSLWQGKLSLLPAIRFSDVNDANYDLTKKLGIVGHPLSHLSIKGNIETAHRVPTFNELYFPDQGYIRGNPALKKEKSTAWDIGAGVDGSWGRAEISYFHQAIDNAILFVPISAFTIQPVNTFASTSQGWEAILLIKPTRWFDLAGDYTLTDAFFNGNGDSLPGRARHKWNIRPTFYRSFGQWKGSCFGVIQHVSDMPIDVSNTVILDGRTTLDLGLSAEWSRYFSTIRVDDITNIQTYDVRGFPLPRRTITLSIGGRWGTEEKR